MQRERKALIISNLALLLVVFRVTVRHGVRQDSERIKLILHSKVLSTAEFRIDPLLTCCSTTVQDERKHNLNNNLDTGVLTVKKNHCKHTEIVVIVLFR